MDSKSDKQRMYVVTQTFSFYGDDESALSDMAEKVAQCGREQGLTYHGTDIGLASEREARTHWHLPGEPYRNLKAQGIRTPGEALTAA